MFEVFMSLISTIGSLATNNYGTLLKDLGKSIENAFTGNNFIDYYVPSSKTPDPKTQANFFDLRGRNCVFRGLETSGYKHFDMEKDFYWYRSAIKSSLFE
jgi:hypothetical protein